ncbi:MAG TPA: protein-ADP-ribose hydrolase [Candidatus Butyricicoccus stercorigallinarum]|nr:protein-ADP-ribose hydrolase [Candidatus Butyricicoccus stercorigallinarum]
MTQSERRAYLIRALLAEQPGYRDLAVPQSEAEQKRLLRALMNLREPQEIDAAFLRVQDAYLQEEAARKGITALDELTPVEPGLYLWQGDITTLCCDAIVNAANSGLTGCYIPCHSCIDNAIHTYAGVQLRLACARLLTAQGHPEPTGTAKLTPAYNLPCRYVLHTVGPIVRGALTERDEEALASCYRACLELARENGLRSVAFCCISTGEFHFPNRRAAEIAVQTVRAHRGEIEVIFNVFKDLDREIYRTLLG